MVLGMCWLDSILWWRGSLREPATPREGCPSTASVTLGCGLHPLKACRLIPPGHGHLMDPVLCWGHVDAASWAPSHTLIQFIITVSLLMTTEVDMAGNQTIMQHASLSEMQTIMGWSVLNWKPDFTSVQNDMFFCLVHSEQGWERKAQSTVIVFISCTDSKAAWN